MAFEKDLPILKEPGSELPEEIKNNGWNPEDPLAAQHLNNMFHKTYNALDELQKKAAEKDEVNQQLTHTAKQVDIAKAQNAKISYASNPQIKPCLVPVFDDGKADEYTKTYQLLKSLDVKGTFYINTKISNMLPKNQTKEMHENGMEIGAHTSSHILLDRVNAQAITQGATTITLTTSTNTLTKIQNMETKILVYDSNLIVKSTEIEVVSSAVVDGKMVLTLAEPMPIAYSAPLVRYADSTIEEQLAEPIEYLRELNVPCKHFAYPYGSSYVDTRRLVAKYYASGREALSYAITSSVNANGGVVKGVDVVLDQYAIQCADLGGSTNTQIDDLLNKIIAQNGFGVVLGHAADYDTWQAQLTYAVNRARALGIEIVTMSEALEMHGNLLDLSDFSINRNGRLIGKGAVRTLPRASVTPTTNLWNYPEGIALARFGASDAHSFPTQNGTLAVIRPQGEGLEKGSTSFLWLDADGEIYYRAYGGGTSDNYGAFKKIAFENRVSRTVTTTTFDINPNGVYYLELLSIGTNDATFEYAERWGDHLQTLLVNNIFVIPKVKDGICYLMVVNKGTVLYNVPAMTINVTANKF